ncbi:hypothetical protein HZC07_01720 [Candidatus Micrarchaeota archaeon]|nr:hypothetical protein [Candidatus Micrarchaeota archaeon]
MDEETKKLDKILSEAGSVVEKKLPCSSCKKEITCPEHMMTAERYLCYDCFKQTKSQLSEDQLQKTYVDVPANNPEAFQGFIEGMVGDAFIDIWSKEKDNLKELSKKELAQALFFEGAFFMFNFMQAMSEEARKEAEQPGAKK